MIFRRPAGPDDVAALTAELELLRAERRELVNLCIYARDRLDSDAAAARIDRELERLGVAAIVPDGEPFDPTSYEAAAAIDTGDASLHDTVAETELPGYDDRGETVRAPVVSVFRTQVAELEAAAALEPAASAPEPAASAPEPADAGRDAVAGRSSRQP